MNAPDETFHPLERAAHHRAGHRPGDVNAIGGLLAFPSAKQNYYDGRPSKEPSRNARSLS
jgi:hypothetical protein